MKRTIITWAVTLLLVSAAIVWAGWKASYTELAVTPATDDALLIVDVSDTTMASTGTTKWISYTNFFDPDLTTYAGITPSANIQSFLGAADYAAMQALLSVDDLVTLSGVADGETTLGFFTGSTITDSTTIANALQELETAVESKVSSANPTFTGTVILPDTNTLPATGRIRPATSTDTHYIGLAAHNGTDWQDVVRIVNDSAGTPEFQLQSGAALTGLGTLTIENEGILRNEIDTSTDYFRLQATDDVGGTPVQTDALKITNSGTTAAAKIEIGNTLTATKVYLTATADTMANLDWNGTAIVGKNCGESITAPAVVYWSNTDGEWMMADADAAGKWPARGIAVADCSNGAAGTVLVQGIIRYDTWGWTSGETLYLDDVAGAVINSAGIPATSGDCVQVIGWALSDDEAYFNFTGHYLEVE